MFQANMRLGAGIYREKKLYMAHELIKKVGLEGKDMGTISSLSVGERRRLALGCGIITRPDILFVDEPLSGSIEGLEARMITDLLRDLCDNDGMMVITTM